MRIMDRPDVHEREGHIFFAVLTTAICMDSTVIEGEVGLFWERNDPLTAVLNIELFPGATLVQGTRTLSCDSCEESIEPGALVIQGLEQDICTTCAEIEEGMEQIWTISLEQLESALEDRADRPRDLGDVQMNRHLGSRLKMRLSNEYDHYITLDFSAHRLEQFVNSIRYYQACNGGAEQVTQAFIADGIRRFEEYLSD